MDKRSKAGANERIVHGILSLLLSLGLTLPVCHALGIGGNTVWLSAGICSAAAIVLAALGMNRLAAWTGTAVGCLGLIGWLWWGQGAVLCTELFQAARLQLMGMTAALPLYAVPASVLLSVLISILSWAMSARATGALPAWIAVILMLVLAWQMEDAVLIWLMVPAAAAALALSVQSAHPSMNLNSVIPSVTIVALLAAFLIPAGGISIQPLKEETERLRQRILDYFFFTDPRDVFSLAYEGYYPQGNAQLGGAVTPSAEMVMQVLTPKKTYLRGVIRDVYTGRNWLDSTGGRRYQWISPRWQSDRTRIFEENLPAEALPAQQVSVRIEKGAQTTLYVPQRIRALSVSSDMTPYFNNASEVFITRNLKAGDTYSVQAVLISAEEAGVRELVNDCSGDPFLYEQIAKVYTVLPEHLQSLVFEMAQSAAGDSDTPFDRAMAIEQYLRANAHYTLKVEDQPEDVDFVSNFLLKTKEGYCTYFASAMTVLCRMVGLPARYVEGYLAEPDESGLACVTGENAHAWVEVYFSGFGWLTFDPTPPVSGGNAPGNDDNSGNPPPPPEEPEPSPEPSPEPEEEPEEETENAPEPSPEPTENPDGPEDEPSAQPPVEPETPEQKGHSLQWWLWLLLLIILLLAAFRIWWMQPERVASRKQEAYGAYLVWFSALCRLLAAQRKKRQPGETVLQYFGRIDQNGTMAELGYSCSAVLYGRRNVDANALVAIEEAWHQQYGQLRFRQKAVLALYFAFGRKPYDIKNT